MISHKLLGLRLSVALGMLALAGLAAPARADRILHPTAVFSGLDKITGRIISFEVATNETVQFGSLQITEKACYTRPATEAPQTITFAQVDEIDAKKQYKRIFSGWMFASSPGLNGIEHPVYDIWLTDCKGGKEIQKTPETAATDSPLPPTTAEAAAQKKDAAKNEATKNEATKDEATKDDAAKGDTAKDDTAKDDAPKPEKKRRVARRKSAPHPDDSFDAGMTPDAEPQRQAPARSFFPDAAGGRDPGGFY